MERNKSYSSGSRELKSIFVNPLHLPVEQFGLPEMKFRFQKKRPVMIFPIAE